MLHYMKLTEEPFYKMKSGHKTVELRLNDEKRQKVKTGDFIEFTLIGNDTQKITVRVTALHYFESFQKLFSAIPKEKMGYKDDEFPDTNYMDKFYSTEEQKKYGAVGIEVRMTDLQRFLNAQEYGYNFNETYQTALSEIKNGMKESHWMWYIFPQIKGLGFSCTAMYFSIHDINEAVDYIQHPVLRMRLIQISSELLKLPINDPMIVFGYPDAFKLHSCITLFKYAAPDELVFQQVIEKFFNDTEDSKTLKILGK